LVPKKIKEKPAIIVICGPTGSGKGTLARQVCHELDGEIISADSRKVYRGLDIGTAKPSLAAREGIPYHLVDVCEPEERFSAARFVKMADLAIDAIVERSKIPVLAGGTGLYIRALLHGLIDTPASDENLRRKLIHEEKKRPGTLHARLLEVDRPLAERIPKNDRLRLVRALEVFELSGRVLSSFQKEHGFSQNRFDFYQVAIEWPREVLDERIEKRVWRMMEQGLVEETKFLQKKQIGNALRIVGYRQIHEHLLGHYSLKEATQKIQMAHKKYSRQQMTWFKAVEELNWLKGPVDIDGLLEKIKNFIKGRNAHKEID
jgi:tRNA dimethylallyltransferase